MKADVIVRKEFSIGRVDDRIFGGFVEHLGRCVYGGIYEPDHPDADADGFRRDVAALARELNMPVVRYPGGNFVSGYDWRDTVGPKEQRPVRADYAWQALEPNQVGIDEFMKWCGKVNTSPMMAVNLGTGSAKSAQELVEYCNFPNGTAWSELRRKNGTEAPHGIRLWCLGNEMDGPWQIGCKTAEEYARLAHEAGKMMKMADPSIELVVCGSSSRGMPKFAEWDAHVLEECFEIADYIALHAYFEWEKSDAERKNFFASAEVLDRQIRDIIAVCDFVAAKKKSSKQTMLALDEWNVWYRERGDLHPETRWRIGRPLLEEVYDMADAIVVGGLLMTMLEHADRLKIGCLAQLVNVIAPIMTRPGGGCWKQTIWYPFFYTSKYGRGTVLKQCIETPEYTCDACPHPVGYLKSCAVYDGDAGELRIFALNRSIGDSVELRFEMSGFEPERTVEAIELRAGSLDAVNTEREENVSPAAIPDRRYSIDGCVLNAVLAPASWNMFRIALKKSSHQD